MNGDNDRITRRKGSRIIATETKRMTSRWRGGRQNRQWQCLSSPSHSDRACLEDSCLIRMPEQLQCAVSAPHHLTNSTSNCHEQFTGKFQTRTIHWIQNPCVILKAQPTPFNSHSHITLNGWWNTLIEYQTRLLSRPGSAAFWSGYVNDYGRYPDSRIFWGERQAPLNLIILRILVL